MYETGSIREAFNPKVFENAFDKNFLIPTAVSAGLAFLVSLVLSLVPILGMLVAGYISTVVFWTYMGTRLKA